MGGHLAYLKMVYNLVLPHENIQCPFELSYEVVPLLPECGEGGVLFCQVLVKELCGCKSIGGDCRSQEKTPRKMLMSVKSPHSHVGTD